MYFYDFNKIVGEAVSYSTAAGQPINGKHLQLSLLRFEAQGGAEEHAHSYEQIMYVISGKLRVRIGQETNDIGPGQAFLAPPNVKHQVTALESSEVVSCKNLN
jgi:quercetin dioxygenase-like cupin family protein